MPPADARAAAWLEELLVALQQPSMQTIERLRRELPGQLDDPRVGDAIDRIAALVGRTRAEAAGSGLAWWLDALLLQSVIRVPRSRSRDALPWLFIALSVLLGLLVGRMIAAGVMALGLVVWAVRAGGSVQRREGDWVQLGDVLFDLRQLSPQRLDAHWYLLGGQRVPAAALIQLGVVKPHSTGAGV